MGRVKVTVLCPLLAMSLSPLLCLTGSVLCLVTQLCPTLATPWTTAHQTPLSMGILQARILEWVALFRRIFPIQGSNPGLPHCRWILYQLSHKGSPRILEWVAYPFSSGSSQPRNWTRVSWIAGKFFTNWAIREAPFMVAWDRWKKINWNFCANFFTSNILFKPRFLN